MNKKIFITGMGRSGTTLVDKLFGCFPHIESFSQPLPLLLVQLKKDFLSNNGFIRHQINYPLSDQQFDNSFDVKEFTKYLQNKKLDVPYIQAILSEMVTYSGQYFKPEDVHASLENWKVGNLSEYIQHYFTTHQSKNRDDVNAFAWKEVVSEAFIPYLYLQGFQIFLVIRDPRDVLTSICEAKVKSHTGLSRPILWVIRQWRKSVAYKLQFEHENKLKTVRYEELVNRPDEFLDENTNWMETRPLESVSTVIHDGLQQWSGNSSFSEYKEVSQSSVGRYIEYLSIPMRNFVEALCYGEMKALGYDLSITIDDVEELLLLGPPKDYLEREALAHYAYSDKRKEEELRRWRALSNSNSKFEPTMFIFERTYLALKQKLNS